MTTKDFNWQGAKQLSVVQILLAFFLPSVFAFCGFRVVLPIIVAKGTPAIIAWPTIASVMLFIFVVLAFYFLSNEAKSLKISLVTRLCLKKLSIKQWLIYLLIMIVGMIASMMATNLVVPFMKITGISIPDYMPFFLDPTVNPMETAPELLTPGFVLKGSYFMLPLMAVTLFLNILTEELYFRAWILPKLTKYGNWGWIINGVFFALYHTYQLWLLPTILTMSLFTAFVVYKSKSIWPAFVLHFIGNFLFSILSVLMLIMS